MIDRRAQPQPAFLRSHDAQGTRLSQRSNAWRPVPSSAANGPVLLILRDPLESYVRMAKSEIPRMNLYAGNLNHFDQHKGPKAVAHYEEITTDPAAMLAAITHLDLPGKAPTLEQMTAEWAELSHQSRTSYNSHHTRGGGAKTANDPQNFTFHQQNLTAEQKAAVWQYLDQHLTPQALTPIDRYRKD